MILFRDEGGDGRYYFGMRVGIGDIISGCGWGWAILFWDAGRDEECYFEMRVGMGDTA